MYKYRIRGKKENKFQIENLESNKVTIVSDERVYGYAKKGLVTNAVVRNSELFQVKDALETYIKLRDKIWEVASMTAIVGGVGVKNGTIYTIRLFDGYGEDITQVIFDFVYVELNLKLDGKGNILYAAKTLNPLEDFKTVINLKCQKIQQNLVPEKSEMVYDIAEYRISKAMQEVIKSWDC